MASSKVMASTSSTNPDPPRQSSSRFIAVSDLQSDHSKALGSMNMDDLLKDMYSDSGSFPSENGDPGGDNGVGNKTVDEGWKGNVAGSNGTSCEQPEMTLEDFLTNAGAVREEEVRAPAMLPSDGFGVNAVMTSLGVSAAQYHAPVHMQPAQKGPVAGKGFFEADAVGFGVPTGGVGRGKKRSVVVDEACWDKATLQKQRRMIKNRESAARSRERKQAYTVELESLVTRLEEENARLSSEVAQQNRERFKQLLENLIPVVENQRSPPRVLRKVKSMTW